MRVLVMTSLPAADCSMSLLLQWETRGRRWFEGDDDRRRHQPGSSATGYWLQIVSRVGRHESAESLVHQHGMLVRDSLHCTQPIVTLFNMTLLCCFVLCFVLMVLICCLVGWWNFTSLFITMKCKY